MKTWCQATEDGVILTLRVVPRASRNEIAGVLQDALKVRLQSPPVDGKANKALVAFLAKTFDVPRRDISIVSGHSARTKRVAMRGVSPAAFSDCPA